MALKIKIYELAKELGVDNQQLVDVIQRLGIDTKNPMSALGTEEVRSVREYFAKNRPVAKPVSAPPTKAGVTEKRVGATVIRRRAKVVRAIERPTPSAGVPAEVSPSEETVVGAPEEETILPVEAEAVVTRAPDESESVGPEVSVPVEEAPEAIAPRRKVFPSIIKKVATEAYLGAVVGPKPEKKAESPKGTKSDQAQSDGAVKGPKRLKEIDISASIPAGPAKDSKRRTSQ